MMTWGQEVFHASLHSEPASALGLPTVWSLWGNPGMARCWEMSTLHAGYIPQHKVTSESSSGSLGFIVCVKCCRMVDSVPRWCLSLSWPIQSDHLLIADRMIPPSGQEHSHGKTQHIPGKQVLARSWLWKIYLLQKSALPKWPTALLTTSGLWILFKSSLSGARCM